MVAIVPILPVLIPLMSIIGWGLISVLALLGLSGSSERNRMIRRFLWKQRYSLLVILGGCALSWWGIQQGITHWNRPSMLPVPIMIGDDWPLFRGNPQRTGAVHPAATIDPQTLLWSGIQGDRFYSSPTVVGNRVYAIGSQGDRGRIYCWNVAEGELQWVAEPLGMRATFSSPVVVGNFLLCGEGLHRTTNARVFCLDISQPNPSVVWSLETRSHVECTPVVVGERVYVAAGDDGVYALDLRAGPPPKVHWHATGGHLSDVETALIADSENVYVGTGHGSQSLVILDALTGQQRSSIPFTHPLFAPPALVGDRLYVGMGQGDFVKAETDAGGAVACIDTHHGTVVWTLPLPATVLGAIVFSEGELLFGCADGLIRVVSPAGEIIHSWDSGAAVNAALAVTPRVVCGVNTKGRLFVLDRQTLQLLSERSLGSEGHFLSSPTIAGERVFVGTERYGLQCLGERPTP